MSFLKIAITLPHDIENEAKRITALLNDSYDYVHIRKPDASLRTVRNLIEDIPYSLRCRLKLHGHFELLNEMSLGGAHLNSRNPKAPLSARLLSKSCHTLDEIAEAARLDYEYLFLSPIFDSISKINYKSKFDIEKIYSEIRDKKVVALGGVDPSKFELLEEKGFFGAALLGYIWQ